MATLTRVLYPHKLIAEVIRGGGCAWKSARSR